MEVGLTASRSGIVLDVEVRSTVLSFSPDDTMSIMLDDEFAGVLGGP